MKEAGYDKEAFANRDDRNLAESSSSGARRSATGKKTPTKPKTSAAMVKGSSAIFRATEGDTAGAIRGKPGQEEKGSGANGTATAATFTHGLKGHYYIGHMNYDPPAFPVKDYNIPVGNRAPDAISVDVQLDFGRGKGFVRDFSHEPHRGQLVWWTPESAQVVVWKGYVRLPKAGTYCVITAAHGASAVYVIHTRVAFNEDFGGSIPSPTFTIRKT
jgi:hypothetical protein